MPSNDLKVPVQTVRICKITGTIVDTFDTNVEVCLLFDKSRDTTYLRVQVDDTRQFSCNVREAKWIDESSSKGMATIRTLHNTVIIFYDAGKKEVLDFFLELPKMVGGAIDQPIKAEIHLNPSPPLEQVQRETMVNELVALISTGHSEKAKRSAEQLAAHRVNVQFHLSNKQVSLKTRDAIEKPKDPDLELTLQVEFQAPKEPIQIPITVHCGSTLRSIKRQVEQEVGIKYSDQHWFAYHRYPLSDEYIFGSSMSISSNQISRHPIQSGDTLYMYVAQSSVAY